VSIRGIEYAQLLHQGFTPENAFGRMFYTLTGIHGLHVLAGVLWCLGLLTWALWGSLSSRNHLGIEIFSLYWQFTDVVWIILFPLIYLI
jgi:heme/copper-type cytochrome/quinol oxidase subunit 3